MRYIDDETASGSGGDNILNYNNAGTHNSIYLEGDLGNTLTAVQSAAIRAGTFENIYVGKTWTFHNVLYTYVNENDENTSDTYSGTMRAADCDYFLRCGDTDLTAHHVVVVPDENLFEAKMNDTATTTGGYVGSKMYTTHLRRAEAIFKACFGEDHILSHREFLVSLVVEGKPSGGIWADRLVDLMDERMVYGSLILLQAQHITEAAKPIPTSPRPYRYPLDILVKECCFWYFFRPCQFSWPLRL